MTNNKLYDIENLTAVANGDDEFIKSMIVLFLQNTPSQAEELLIVCKEQSWDRVYFLAHKMKASINLVNINALKDEIKTIEVNAKTQQNLDAVPAMVQHVHEVIQNTADQMKADYNL